ncbi:uncharacterized protein [Hetaerina americana]|uniref:uncharacterized protein n=1 Tax=Hetaerina americana TaxID=62018 RepID=UPI003A7F10AC
MGRVAVGTSQRCRIQPPFAVAVVVLACLASHAYGSCLSYGHSCWGAHGKRSGGAGARGYVNEDLLGESGRISRGALSQEATSPPSSSDPQDTLWFISKLMAANRLDPEGEGGDDEGSSEEDSTAGAKIWRRLLDVNQGAPSHRARKLLRSSKLQMDGIPVSSGNDFGGGVGIFGFASAPDGELSRGLVVLADPEEDQEGEGEDQANESKGRDVFTEDVMEAQGEGRRMSRKALRRLRILNLWDNMDKKSN